MERLLCFSISERSFFIFSASSFCSSSYRRDIFAKRSSESLPETLSSYAEQLAFKTPEHSELFHAVMALPQKYRVPLFLHYYEGYSCEEISQFLGIPNATVRTRLRRGREQLKTDLQEANNNV